MMPRILLLLAALAALSGCVDGKTGQFFICGVTTHCK